MSGQKTKKSTTVHQTPVTRRLLAGIIDGSINGTAFYYTSLYFDLNYLFPEAKVIFHQLFILGFYYLLFTIFPHTIFSQTLGKTIMRIKVLNLDLKRVPLIVVIFRDAILRPLSLIMPWMFFMREGKGLHDFICRTIVVSES